MGVAKQSLLTIRLPSAAKPPPGCKTMCKRHRMWQITAAVGCEAGVGVAAGQPAGAQVVHVLLGVAVAVAHALNRGEGDLAGGGLLAWLAKWCAFFVLFWFPGGFVLLAVWLVDWRRVAWFVFKLFNCMFAWMVAGLVAWKVLFVWFGL